MSIQRVLTSAILLAFIFTGCSIRGKYTSVDGLNARAGCPAFFSKLAQKKAVTIVYFGGSITNHEGYRIYSEEWFKQNFPGSEITAINAGIGGTGSDLGVFRMDDDVMAHNPDLVFIEFAVNDSRTDSLTISRSMEGIVRKLMKHCPESDICFLYTLNQPMLDDLLKGNLFRSMRIMENVAEHYEIPSVNFSMDVVDLLVNDSLIFKGEKKVDNVSEKIFTTDGTHPTLDYGHKIYTKTLTRSMLEMSKMKTGKKRANVIPPLDPENYELAKSIPISEFSRSSGWEVVGDSSYIYDNYLGSSNIFPTLLCSSNPNDFIKVCFKGKIAGLFDVIGPSSSGYTVEVNGADIIKQRRFDGYCGSFYRSNYSLLPEMKDTTYTLIIRPDSTRFDKRSIYDVKPVKISDSSLFNEYNMYAGSILIIGDLIKNVQ